MTKAKNAFPLLSCTCYQTQVMELQKTQQWNQDHNKKSSKKEQWSLTNGVFYQGFHCTSIKITSLRIQSFVLLWLHQFIHCTTITYHMTMTWSARQVFEGTISKSQMVTCNCITNDTSYDWHGREDRCLKGPSQNCIRCIYVCLMLKKETFTWNSAISLSPKLSPIKFGHSCSLKHRNDGMGMQLYLNCSSSQIPQTGGPEQGQSRSLHPVHQWKLTRRKERAWSGRSLMNLKTLMRGSMM